MFHPRPGGLSAAACPSTSPRHLRLRPISVRRRATVNGGGGQPSSLNRPSRSDSGQEHQMRSIRRRGFEITEERLFWEADAAQLSPGLQAVVTDSRHDPERDSEDHECHARRPIATAVSGESVQQPQPQAGRVGLRDGSDPRRDCASRPLIGESTLDRLGAALPAWALEPEWTNAPAPRTRGSWQPAVLSGAAGFIVIVGVSALLGLGPSHSTQRQIETRRPTTHLRVLGHPSQMALAAFRNWSASPSQPLGGTRPHPASRRHEASRDHHRSAVHPARIAPKRRRAKHVAPSREPGATPARSGASPRSATPSAPVSAGPSPPPATAAVSSPTPDPPPAPAPAAAAPAAPPQSSAPQSSGSSEFNFEQ